MRERPRELSWVALFLVAIALALPLQIMVLYGHWPTELLAIATKLGPLNWLVMAMCLGAAQLISRASRWGVALLAPLIGAVAWNNWLVGQAGLDFSPLETTTATMVFVLGLVPLLSRRVWKLLRAPATRWWLTPDRFRVEVPIRIKLMTKGGPEFYAKTLDLSEGGAFIPGLQGGRFHRLEGAQCYISLTLKGYRMLQCRAEVVRWGEGMGRYPAGVALRFLGLSAADRRMLPEFFATLPRETREDRVAPTPTSESKAA